MKSYSRAGRLKELGKGRGKTCTTYGKKAQQHWQEASPVHNFKRQRDKKKKLKESWTEEEVGLREC